MIDKPDNIEKVPTWQATIYVGLQEHYDGPIHSVDEIAKACHDYCDEIGLCVTVTPLQFVYSRGGEPGVAVGLINYPRFPKNFTYLKTLALGLADKLRQAMGQYRVSVVMPDETVMLGEH